MTMKQPTTGKTTPEGRHDAYENLLQRCRELEPVTTALCVTFAGRKPCAVGSVLT